MHRSTIRCCGQVCRFHRDAATCARHSPVQIFLHLVQAHVLLLCIPAVELLELLCLSHEIVQHVLFCLHLTVHVLHMVAGTAALTSGARDGERQPPVDAYLRECEDFELAGFSVAEQLDEVVQRANSLLRLRVQATRARMTGRAPRATETPHGTATTTQCSSVRRRTIII